MWRLIRRRRRPEPAPDPLTTLAVQIRLTDISAELRRIERDPDVYARAHHYFAVQGAYDALLRQACQLTGLDVQDDPVRAGAGVNEEDRFQAELELSSRGWSW